MPTHAFPRLLCLDGLRGGLAVYVMVSHMAPFVPMPNWLAVLLSHGGAGVDAFFVLSGLVIVQSLEAHDWRRGRFLAARAWRIFPVYLVVFGFAVGVQMLDGPGAWAAMPWIAPGSPARDIWSLGWPPHWPAALLAHLTMTHGLFPDAVLPDVWVAWLGAAWSLSTEWQFYALAALCAPLLRRAGFGLAGFAALLVVLAVLGATWQAVAPAGYGFSRAFLPNKAAYFALGVASALLLRGAAIRVFAAVLVATLLLCLLQGADKLAVPVLWVACLAAQAVPGRTRTVWLARLLTRREMLWLGAVSYPLYLVNEPAQKLLGRALAAGAQGDAAWFAAWWIPAALALPVGLAWLLHVGVERPAMRRRRAAPVGRPRVAGHPADALCAGPKWTSRIRSLRPRIPMSRSPTG